MKDNLDHCFQLVLGSEGGFVNNPADPGGATQMGVTQKTLSAWRKRPCSIEDVKALTETEAVQIYSAQYAEPIHFDELPSGLDLAVFDTSINSGPDRAARLLQQTLGMPAVTVDGVIGMHTLAALHEETAPHATELISAYCAARLDFMRSLATWDTFGKGWTARVNRVEADAKKMAVGEVPVLAPARVTVTADADGGQAKAGGSVKVTATNSGKAAIVNVIATIATAVVTAGTAATQASGVLQPYADISVVHYVLLGLAVVSAAGTLMVALTRAHNGATT